MKTFKELEKQVIQWGEERDLYCPINGGTATSQLHKFFEEFGELNKAILRNDLQQIKDGIGDCQVTLINRAKLKGVILNFEEDGGKAEADEIYQDVYETLKGKMNESFFEEITRDICRNAFASIKDCIVILDTLGAGYGFKMWECLDHAYNEIKDRKGKMINRTFVKDEN